VSVLLSIRVLDEATLPRGSSCIDNWPRVDFHRRPYAGCAPFASEGRRRTQAPLEACRLAYIVHMHRGDEKMVPARPDAAPRTLRRWNDLSVNGIGHEAAPCPEQASA
jgi:hypothetical protein